MASSKIKKKSTGVKTTPIPRQGAVPCLVIVVVVLIVVGLLLYFSLRSAA
ncbi:MAG: hypothetical protein JOY54_16785 [Acidobacteriaceae bacterium]|nr:hypothetical protein [Acidobacteriaceae bacterium]